MDVDGAVIVGSLELASLQSNQKYFMDSANVKLARSAKLPNEYCDGLLIQAGEDYSWFWYVLINTCFLGWALVFVFRSFTLVLGAPLEVLGFPLCFHMLPPFR